MKILLLFLSEPWTPYSPSIAALAAAVRAAGHEPVALAISLNSTVRDAVREIKKIAPDVVGSSVMSRDWPGVRSLMRQLKATLGVVTVVGGYHATLAPRDVAACDAIDAICVGEGEIALPALLDRLARGERGGSFPGMWVRGSDGWTDPIPPGAAAADIASLPPWEYEVFGDVPAMLSIGINIFGGKRDRFLPTRASRGCPFDCTYCSAPFWGKASGFDGEGKRNVRPVEHLCGELGRLRDRFRPAGFEFWDEHFPIDLGWLAELSREYPRRVGLPFRMEMHPNAATRQRLELLAAAGCELFHCGVEAGDPDYRRRVLHRRSSDALLERVFDDARSLGMRTSASVMIALPGETMAQAQMTLALLRKLRPATLFCSTYMPLPGTPLGNDHFRMQTPDIERFDDFRGCMPPSAFLRMSNDEVVELHRQYAALLAELHAG